MTTRIETLRSLQKRIRESKGADREIDFAICKAFGRAPDDAIWEVHADMPPELAKHYKKGWVSPAYAEYRREYGEGVNAAFAEHLPPDETASRIRALEREWDFKNAPPFGNVSGYTASLDACVALMAAVLPGWKVRIRQEAHTVFAEVYLGPDEWHTTQYASHDHMPQAFIDAIFSAVIAELEARKTTG